MRRPAAHAPGEIVNDRYRIEGHLGAGGMGDVYRATQLAMGRQVALKILRRRYGPRHQRAQGRFQREMEASSRIRHPNTVEVFDFGVTGEDELFLAMELLDGQGLDQVIREQAPLPPDRIAHIGAQIARALAAAHDEGVIHRDLKPANIMVVHRYESWDFVKVLDFGVARFMDPDQNPGLTSSGMLVGTPLYLAPEYIAQDKLDHRADLYALGVVLFELTTGRTPFTGPPDQLLSVTVNHRPPRPSSVTTVDVPLWLEELILGLLDKNPDLRPPDARTVAEALELNTRKPGRGPAAHPQRRGGPPMWFVVAAAATLSLGAATGGFVLAWVLLTG